MPYNSDKWTTSEGEDRYRRGLYTFWRRTSPYPSFMTFDATSREFCTVRRVRTNTPLQALTLLNDPASFEAARALAARVMASRGGPDDARARLAFRLVPRAKPMPAEVDRLVASREVEQLVALRRAEAAAADACSPVADECRSRRTARRGRSSRTCC